MEQFAFPLQNIWRGKIMVHQIVWDQSHPI